ncbi:hypothetical protein TPA0907_02670 [Micromonospora humidisoli]|uniref:hypothetical protein n=1 Tax=Micromonospora sp. AKA109 TaxID=2733865 RepID=UPI0022BB8123|nr:hypothetical protein [Micromonospora sp. AKA109]GHJ05900.1 hypothetical protein TPA0907_02670 [Micromonospora sp. AKA109]
MVTSAGNNGQLVTDIDYSLNRRTGRFTSITAKNVIVENGVRNADGTWQQTGGVFAKNRRWSTRARRRWPTSTAPRSPRSPTVVGKISADIVRDARPNGEQPRWVT